MQIKSLTRSLAVAALGLLLAGPLLAHEGKEGMDDAALDKSLNKAGVSDTQKDQIKEARKDNADKMKDLWERKKDDLDKLQSQVTNQSKDSDLEATLQQLKDDHKAIEAQSSDFMEKLEGILTPMQKAKLVLDMKEKMKK